MNLASCDNPVSDLERFDQLFRSHYLNGALTGDRYTSTEFYEREWEGMWTKTWLLLGRSRELPEPGDYVVDEIGKESFVMIRQDDGAVRTFYNVCQHRGNRLALVREGSAKTLACSYHSWVWGIDGVLVAMQDEQSFPDASPCGKLRLKEVKCEEFAGFVWINMDPDCGSLAAYLGPVGTAMQPYPLRDMARIQAFSVHMPCNWKALIDNFQEVYHFATVHREFLNYVEDDYRNLTQEIFEGGHGLLRMKAAMPARRFVEEYGHQIGSSLREELIMWDLDPEDYRERVTDARIALQRQKRSIGPDRGHSHYDALSDEQLTDVNHFTVFPNFAVGLVADGMVFHRLRPHATDPNQCIYDAYQFVPANGPVLTNFGNVAGDAVDGPIADVAVEEIAYGSRSIGLILDQDAATMAGQQLGLRSRGFEGGHLTEQEFRVAYYHFMIDQYIERWQAAMDVAGPGA